MKFNAVFCKLLCLAAIFGFVCQTLPLSALNTASNAAPADLAVANGCSTADGQAPLMGSDKLLETAGAAFLFEVNSATVMYAWNPDLQLEPASLVKIMTGLLAIELGEPTAEVTVRKDALNALPGNASTTKLQAGEKITLSELLYCLLVGSSNDAAVVIADHISGSQDAFVAQMNEKAKELDLRGTLFTNAHGLPDDRQVTTARDMAKLVAYACKVDAFMPYFAAIQHTVPATNLSEARELSSTNYMMMEDKPSYYDPRVIGGRTGITANRDRCLAVVAESDALMYIGIVLSAVPVYKEDGYTVKRFGSYEEMGQLLDMGFEGYSPIQLIGQDQILMQCNVTGGDNAVVAMPAQSVSLVLPSGIGLDKLSVQYQQNIHELTAPVEAGQFLTQIQIWYNDICLTQADVIAGNSSQLATSVIVPHNTDNSVSVWKVLLIAVGVLVLLAAVGIGILFGIRYYKRVMFRAQQRRRRRERRRSR